MKKSKLFTIITLAIAITVTTIAPTTLAQAATKKKFVAGEYDKKYDFVFDIISLHADETYTLWVGREWEDKDQNLYYTKISQKNYKKYKVTFKSSNPKIAKVNSKGVVTGIKGGKLGKTASVTITVSSKYGKAKVKVNVNDADKKVRNIMAEQIGPHMDKLTDFEKTIAILHWIDANIEYKRTTNADDTSVLGIITNGYGMCSDKANVMVTMGELVGLDIKFYTNKDIIANHAWCKVKLDGKWYQTDPTTCSYPWTIPSGVTDKSDDSQWVYHPIVEEWDTKGDEFERTMQHLPEDEYRYLIAHTPGTYSNFFRELSEKVGHDQVDHTKYADLFGYCTDNTTTTQE